MDGREPRGDPVCRSHADGRGRRRLRRDRGGAGSSSTCTGQRRAAGDAHSLLGTYASLMLDMHEWTGEQNYPDEAMQALVVQHLIAVIAAEKPDAAGMRQIGGALAAMHDLGLAKCLTGIAEVTS